jgi:hypothetical protein
MLTFVLQCVFSVVVLTAAFLCLRVGARRASAGDPYQAAAWRLTGCAFLWHATSDALQNVFGGIAIAAGSRSAAMNAYLAWDPVMNHGRTFLLDALMVMLVALSVWRGVPGGRFWAAAFGLLALGFVIGSLYGYHEGGFTSRHYGSVAVWDVAELLLVLVALFALLLSNRADRMLWAFLSAYGVGLALGVFWLILLSLIGIPGSWQPPPWTLAAMRLFFAVLMLAAVARRLWQQQKGRRVRGILEPRLGPLPSLH